MSQNSTSKERKLHTVLGIGAARMGNRVRPPDAANDCRFVTAVRRLLHKLGQGGRWRDRAVPLSDAAAGRF